MAQKMLYRGAKLVLLESKSYDKINKSKKLSLEYGNEQKVFF